MKFSLASIVVLSAVSVSALVQRADAVPACANTCLATESKTCNGNALTAPILCLCKDDDWTKAVQECVITSCSGSDLVTVANLSAAQCTAAEAPGADPNALAGGGVASVSASGSGTVTTAPGSSTGTAKSSTGTTKTSTSSHSGSSSTTNSTGAAAHNAVIAFGAVLVGAALI